MNSVLLNDFNLCVSVAHASVNTSQNTEVDLSCSGLTELDLGADEVFMASSVLSPGRLPVSPHTVRINLGGNGSQSKQITAGWFTATFSDDFRDFQRVMPNGFYWCV